MADLAQTLAVRTTLSHERADVLARCWRLLAAERHWSEEQTEHIALACAMADVHPMHLRRALAPVPIGSRIEMTDLPTGPPTRCAVPPPPPPPPQGWRDTELRQDALHLAVQSIEATSAIGGWVDEARTAVLDTAEVYLAWLRTGERGGRQVPVCEACRGSGYQLLNDRPTGNPCPACAGEATDA